MVFYIKLRLIKINFLPIFLGKAVESTVNKATSCSNILKAISNGASPNPASMYCVRAHKDIFDHNS